MVKLIVVKGDTNDADYVTKVSVIDEEKLDRFLPLIKAINEFPRNPRYGGRHNWPSSDYANETVSEVYSDFDEELLEDFSYYVPRGEYGIHSIEGISILEVSQITNFFGTTINNY